MSDTANLNYNGPSNFVTTANGNSLGAIIPVNSTTNLNIGQYVSVTSGTGAFLNCTGLTNYASIPANWK